MLYIALSTLCYCFQNIANKEFGRRLPCLMPGIALLDAVSLTVVAILAGLFGGWEPLPEGAFAIIIVFSITYVATIFLIILSMATGPFSLTMLIINMSMIISAIAGPLLWNEAVTAARVIGVLCMCGVVALSALSGRTGPNKPGARWLLFTLGATAANGLLAVLKKEFFWRFPGTTATAYTMWGFFFAAGICWLIVLFFMLGKRDFRSWTGQPKAFYLCAAGIAVGSTGGNIFQAMALKAVDAIIVFPMTQGLLLLTLWLVSVFGYRERARPAGIVAFVLGISGIVLLGVFV